MKEKYKAIRKSAFMTYKHCPKQFEYLYADPKYWDYGNKEGETDIKKKRGNEFHAVMETFFDNFDCLTITSSSELRSRLPKTDDEKLDRYFDWICEIEFKRLQELKDKTDWIPVANELKVYMEDVVIDRTGHVDRIDPIPGTKDLMMVEYKAGGSYDMGKSDRLTNMNAEIGWYVQIMNAVKTYPEYRITHWKVINPELEKVWINKISPISLKAVEKSYATLVEMITKTHKFPKVVSPLCDYCDYLYQCDPFYEETDLIDFAKPL